MIAKGRCGRHLWPDRASKQIARVLPRDCVPTRKRTPFRAWTPARSVPNCDPPARAGRDLSGSGDARLAAPADDSGAFREATFV
jgi:hypothetical protein